MIVNINLVGGEKQMKIGIIGAMPEEVDLIKGYMQITEIQEVGMKDFIIGKLNNKDIILVYSRCGKVASASTVTILIERYNVNMVIFTGVAGAADEQLNVGDIVIADRLIQHDMDASAIEYFEKFEIPLLKKTFFDVDESSINLSKLAISRYVEQDLKNEIRKDLIDEFNLSNPKVLVGTIASGDQFIADKDKLKQLKSQISNLKCVEMEGAAVAQVCYEYKIPYIVVRVVSDKADEFAKMNFPKFVQETASFLTCGIVRKLLEII